MSRFEERMNLNVTDWLPELYTIDELILYDWYTGLGMEEDETIFDELIGTYEALKK